MFVRLTKAVTDRLLSNITGDLGLVSLQLKVHHCSAFLTVFVINAV